MTSRPLLEVCVDSLDGAVTAEAAGALWDDCLSAGRVDIPPFLREQLPDRAPPPRSALRAEGPRRQARHATNA